MLIVSTRFMRFVGCDLSSFVKLAKGSHISRHVTQFPLEPQFYTTTMILYRRDSKSRTEHFPSPRPFSFLSFFPRILRFFLVKNFKATWGVLVTCRETGLFFSSLFLKTGDEFERIKLFIIWLAPRAGKMNQILRCDWLPERARWSYLAHSGLPAVSRKKNFPESHIINPLLTKLVRSRWLDIGLVLFLRVYGPRLRLGP